MHTDVLDIMAQQKRFYSFTNKLQNYEVGVVQNLKPNPLQSVYFEKIETCLHSSVNTKISFSCEQLRTEQDQNSGLVFRK